MLVGFMGFWSGASASDRPVLIMRAIRWSVSTVYACHTGINLLTENMRGALTDLSL